MCFDCDAEEDVGCLDCDAVEDVVVLAGVEDDELMRLLLLDVSQPYAPDVLYVRVEVL